MMNVMRRDGNVTDGRRSENRVVEGKKKGKVRDILCCIVYATRAETTEYRI